MIDLRQTSEYTNYLKWIGWIIEGNPGNFIFIKKFPIIGSFIKIQRPENLGEKEFKLIKDVAKKYKSFHIAIEPTNSNQVNFLRSKGFKNGKTPFLPSKTIHINLTKTEQQLLKKMHYKTRYNIKKNKNSEIRIQNSKDIYQFAEFWQECALKQRQMFLSQKNQIIKLYKAFNKKAEIIKCTINNKIVSEILLIKTKDIAYYMYAASNDQGKKRYAPTLNVWEAIKHAKAHGCKTFDFEGVFDERYPLKNWVGFSRFKKSFGGNEISYPGIFVKYRFPL